MSRESKLVPSSGTYLCSMQGNICRIRTIGEGLIPIKADQAVKDIKRLYLAGIEARLGYMAYNYEAGRQHKAQ